MPGRHKGDTNAFGELDFSEQAKSITATINNLQAAIEHHIDHSPDMPHTIAKCLGQVKRLLERLREMYGDPRGTPEPGAAADSPRE